MWFDVSIILLLLAGIGVTWFQAPERRRLAGGLVAALGLLAIAWVGLGRWQALIVLGVSFLLALDLALRKSRRGGRMAPLVVWGLRLSTAVGTLLATVLLWLFPVGALPEPAGPFAVGVRSFELADPSRPGRARGAGSGQRRLLVRVWYPAERVGVSPARYFSRLEASTTARGLGADIGFPPLLTHLRLVSTHSRVGVPLAATAPRPLPTLIYSHGFGTWVGQNTVLMEHLASHGYVIYGVQHTGSALDTVFPNGDVLPPDPDPDPASGDDGDREVEGEDDAVTAEELTRLAMTSQDLDERFGATLAQWRHNLESGAPIVASAGEWFLDRWFVHDRLDQGQVPSELADLVAASDFGRTGQLGMSFGGSTSASICAVDPRCAAAVNLDGGDFHLNAFASPLPVPLLMLHSDQSSLYRFFEVEDPAPEQWFNDFSYEDLAGDQEPLHLEALGRAAGEASESAVVHRIEFRDVLHMGFSDLALFVGRPLRDSLLGKAPTGFMLEGQNEFVRAFLDRYLRGVDNGFPEEALERFGGAVRAGGTDDISQWWRAKSEAERSALRQEIDELKAQTPWWPADLALPGTPAGPIGAGRGD